jgi:hypothetical protein
LFFNTKVWICRVSPWVPLPKIAPVSFWVLSYCSKCKYNVV